MLKGYIKYLKDNPQGYWFKRRLYGWGWVPATWQGLVILVIFLALIIWSTVRIDANSHSTSDTLINVVPETILLVLILLFICWKTGEKPRWQWGLPDKYRRK